jgi:acetyl esterase/lipase
MFPENGKSILYGILILSATAPVLAASDKMDFSRTSPVSADEPIPAFDFIRRSAMQSPVLNSNGTFLAAIFADQNGEPRLWAYEFETKRTYDIVDENIFYFNWLNEKRLLFGNGANLSSADIDKLSDIRPLQRMNSSAVIGIPKRNPLRPLVWIYSDYYNNGQDDGVAVLNTDVGDKESFNHNAGVGYGAMQENNSMHMVDTYPGPPDGLAYGYLPDKEGELAFALASKDGILSLYDMVDRKWLKCPVDLETTDILSFGSKPGELVVLAPSQVMQPHALQFMDAVTGNLGEVLFQDKAYDFNGWLYHDPMTHEVVGAVYERSRSKVVWFNEAYREVQKILDGFFPGLVVRIIGNDETGRRYMVSTYSDLQPAIFYLVDLEKHTVGLIKNSAPWIDPKRMQPMNVMKFKTRDGHELDAYVTLPAGASKKNPAPLVVLPHDGPWERSTWGYNELVQFLASRGFAVLQPNYRGSPGYNWMFPDEDLWAFRKMSDDVTDATKTLIASGLVNVDRVAIAGWGFGAYLALAGVVNEPGLYRCAVANEGLFDFAHLIKEEKSYQFDHPAYGRLVRKLGDPKKNQAKFDAISPTRHIDQVRVPVFIGQWKGASGVAMLQARQLDSDLEKNQIPHEFVLNDYPIKKQVEFYTRIEAFLHKNLAAVRSMGNNPAVSSSKP